MSKTKKNIIKLPVETVDNLIQNLEWIMSSLQFWQLNTRFPCNLIAKVCADHYYELRKAKSKSPLPKLSKLRSSGKEPENQKHN